MPVGCGRRGLVRLMGGVDRFEWDGEIGSRGVGGQGEPWDGSRTGNVPDMGHYSSDTLDFDVCAIVGWRMRRMGIWN